MLMLWRGVEVVQGQAMSKGLLCWAWVVDGVKAEARPWKWCLLWQSGHQHWGPWMAFKEVLRSQWWRVGLRISLIISRGFQGNS